MFHKSVCHWCHVMERESFEDREVADALNAGFVCVKVDKEERPDIDSVYMRVCQALTGGGGWPTTILMTPQQKPFYAATYLPKHARYGHPGLLQLLAAVRDKWNNDRAAVLASGESIAQALSHNDEHKPVAAGLDQASVRQAVRQLSDSFDKRYGGFGPAPKFPTPHNLLFLLHCHSLGVEPKALPMVEKTLTAMYQGGIFDHIGFGFARYSTDTRWLAPHFEKMLYDNALIVMALLACYQITEKPLYRTVAERTLSYISREMTSPEGGFYSAQDADIGGEEGKFYTFTPDEIFRVLGKADGALFCERYDITDNGNFEGRSIPNLIGKPLADKADERLGHMLSTLLAYRGGRYELHKDDKILTSWNALMIVAYARAYRVLGDEAYLTAARRAYEFIRTRLADADGLLISYRDSRTKGRGLLDDYAFFIWACLELYDSTFDVRFLARARELADDLQSRFDDPAGGFFLTPAGGERLLFRPKEYYDGAMPSGNSVAAWCLVRLAALTGEAPLRSAADRQLAYFAVIFRRHPVASTFALSALMEEVYPAQELVCVVRDDAERTSLALELGPHYHPQTAVLVKCPENAERLASVAPFTKDYTLQSGHARSFYLCKNNSCSPPFHDIRQLWEQITL